MAKKRIKERQSASMAVRINELQTNPVYHEMPKRDKKVKLDPRFNKMFSDKKFASTSAKIDRRGRPVNEAPQEELRKVYEIECDDSNASDEATGESTLRIDLARGEGNVESSSDEDESAESEEEVEDIWGELDLGVRHVDWTSSRISVCNLDWDKIKAEDIFMALESLKPASGVIESVTIYKSDFGSQRLDEEDKSGPKLKVANEDDANQDNLSSEVIRAYQLDRFKYYYAVVICDSVATANVIYQACDGIEFESSGVKFDLRYIPDEMEFEDSRLRERITSEEFNATKYRPKYNVQSAALKRSSVKVEWDNTDYDRQLAIQKAFDPNSNLDECAGLLASGSEDEDGPEFRFGTQTLLTAAGILPSEEQKNERALVNAKYDNNEEDLRKLEKPEASGLTPFQEYLQRRKHKRKEKKKELKEKRKTQKREISPDFSRRSESKKKMKSSESASKLSVNTDDARFQSLFTDSEFAIDRTHSQFRGGVLADKQVEEKRNKRHKTSEG